MQAYFSNIQQHIIECINQAESSIKIAVAWFTNQELLGQLQDIISSKGIGVQIILSDNYINSKLDFSLIKEPNKVMICNSVNDKFFHEKFAIIDDVKLIVGSYNWTVAAEYYNHESVIVSEDKTLIKQYLIRYGKLEEKCNKYQTGIFDVASATAHKPEMLNQDQFEAIENELKSEVEETLHFIDRNNIPIRSENVRLKMSRYGVIGMIKRLMNGEIDDVQEGFTRLVLAGAKEKTFEAIITQPKYELLFNPNHLNTARRRLQ